MKFKKENMIGFKTRFKEGHVHPKKTREKIGRGNKGKLKPKPEGFGVGRIFSEKAKENISIGLTGRKLSKIQIEKQRESLKEKWEDPLFKDRMSNAHKGYKPSEKHKENIRKALKNLPEEVIKRKLKRNPISSLEKKFLDIINKLNLPYKFVGNGEVIIGRKCPDFVNTNGQKIAVEVFYRRHKQLFRGNVEGWKEERKDIFKKYGWDLKFFNEVEVNEKEIVKRLG